MLDNSLSEKLQHKQCPITTRAAVSYCDWKEDDKLRREQFHMSHPLSVNVRA